MLILPALAFAQKVGERAYLRAITKGGSISICEKQKSSFGDFVPGKEIDKYPDGTVVEGKYGGNGYWFTVDRQPEAIISSVHDVKQKYVDPARLVGKNFTAEAYAMDAPALGDKPRVVRTISVSEKQQLPDNKGDVIVTFTDVYNPGTSNATKKVTKYYGVFEPYRMKLVSTEGKIMPYIYVNGSDSDYLNDEIYGLYYNGDHYMYYMY